ncbi:MAG: ornithine carbamoyltransferase [Hyphomicrobiaceae bacterium]
MSKRQAPAELRHFLDIDQLSKTELRHIVDSAHAIKKAGRRPPGAYRPRALAGAVLALIFEKPSMRTRVSFDLAVRELGGEAIFLSSEEIQVGRRETVADTARVLSRYADALLLRTVSHDTLLELAEHATVPVINGLTNRSHPCQIMADLMTVEEQLGPIEKRKVAWIGDANNVATSWIHAAVRLGFELRIGCPQELAPAPELVRWVKKYKGAVEVLTDPAEAVRGADCIVTDTWVSIGDSDRERRTRLLKPYRVDGAMMRKAARNAIFLHCLPAHRGSEVTAEVIDGPQSVVFDEAENRLHAQKAVLAWCLRAAE